jgi:cytoskeletal protein CcmA (bactofilin family)
MLVAGQFKGEYRGDSIDILPTGVVFGEIHVKNVIIEPNGLFEGESRILRDDDILTLEVQPKSQNIDE